MVKKTVKKPRMMRDHKKMKWPTVYRVTLKTGKSFTALYLGHFQGNPQMVRPGFGTLDIVPNKIESFIEVPFQDYRDAKDKAKARKRNAK